jgi:uncharacterized protein YjbI with pentapeptide repeats
LNEADLTGSEMRWSVLTGADLSGAVMNGANLSDAQLSGAKLNRTVLWEANLSKAQLTGSHLNGAYLNNANLSDSNLTKATLAEAKLAAVSLVDADLSNANLCKADLHGAKLNGADLVAANLAEADLSRARLYDADLSGADLDGAILLESDLTIAKLNQANLTAADLRSATLQRARFDGAILTRARLWETQRAGWSIKGIICERAFWDEEAKIPTCHAPGEFERLYSEQTCVELFYQGGVSTFELNTLPALLHHLASLHPGCNFRLKSIEETGGGARISISVGDSDAETAERIKSEAERAHRAQLALRDNEILRLQIQRDYLESFVSNRLMKVMLAAAAPQIAFNAPVYAPALPSGSAIVNVHQTFDDSSALVSLLDKILERRAEIHLSPQDSAEVESEIGAAKLELEKSSPDKSRLSRSLEFVQKLASEALTKAAGKLGESVVSADWNHLLQQLGQLIHQIR